MNWSRFFALISFIFIFDDSGRVSNLILGFFVNPVSLKITSNKEIISSGVSISFSESIGENFDKVSKSSLMILSLPLNDFPISFL